MSSQHGVIGGEGGPAVDKVSEEETLLTIIKLWASALTSVVGQRGTAADEGKEVALFDRPDTLVSCRGILVEKNLEF